MGTLRLSINEGTIVAIRKAFRSRIDNNMTREEAAMQKITTSEGTTTIETITRTSMIESNPRGCRMSYRSCHANVTGIGINFDTNNLRNDPNEDMAGKIIKIGIPREEIMKATDSALETKTTTIEMINPKELFDWQK